MLKRVKKILVTGLLEMKNNNEVAGRKALQPFLFFIAGYAGQ